MSCIQLHSDGAKTTQQLGGVIAHFVANTARKKGIALLLSGDLGSGKTTFVVGFLRAFGIRPLAVSPTFVIMKKYVSGGFCAIKKTSQSNKRKKGASFFIYHVDAYRLRNASDFRTLGFNEILKNPNAIVLIEWPEQIRGFRFEQKITVRFLCGDKENNRVISFCRK